MSPQLAAALKDNQLDLARDFGVSVEYVEADTTPPQSWTITKDINGVERAITLTKNAKTATGEFSYTIQS